MESEQTSPRQNTGCKIGAIIKQPSFNCGTNDEYSDQKSIKLEKQH